MQTGWKKEQITEKNWRTIIADAIKFADWKKIHADVESFLERAEDMEVFMKEVVLKLVRGN
jgi:hypothetical protein